MKRANYLLPKIAEIDNLRLAFWKASKGKRHSSAVLSYQENIDKNLLDLQSQILSGKVKVGDYRYFKIFEPKERQICASAFSEQVLHHALMNICHSYFEKSQIYHSCASRKGKGTYFAIEQAQNFTKKYTYFLKLDVRKFFDSIAHIPLKTQLERLFKEKIVLSIFTQIIDSYEASPYRGVPIGNLTSQYFANHYLSGLDHFIKEKLACKAYIRYMDDMVLWSDDKIFLKNAFHKIQSYLKEELLCELKPLILRKVALGVPFLGYLLLPSHTRLLQTSKKRFFKKYRKLHIDYHTFQMNENECQRKTLPLLAFVQKAKTKKMREKILELYD